MPTLSQFEFWLFTVLCAGIGAYFGAYLKKSAENLATHEDFEKVLVELQETTRATKQIEAKISDEMWDRQQRWELRKELFLEMLRAVGSADTALDHAASDLIGRGIHTPEHVTQTEQGIEECVKCSRTLGNVRSVLGIVGGLAVFGAFERVCHSYIDATLRLNWKQYGSDDLTSQIYEFRVASDELQRAVRTELGIPMPKFRSNKSSVVPTPSSQVPLTSDQEHSC
jgi:hypothetical protein